MKNNTFSFKTLLLFCFFSSTIYSQVGIGNTNPRGALDINSNAGTNINGLVIPTNPIISSIVNPNGGTIAIGTIMYDSTYDCIRYYKTTGEWSECLQEVPKKEMLVLGDTYSRSCCATTNYSTEQTMGVKRDAWASGNLRNGYLWIDISDYLAPLTSVTLRLNLVFADSNPNSSLNFNLVSNQIGGLDWLETGITENNQPTTISTITSFSAVAMAGYTSGSFLDVNITSQVNAAILSGSSRISIGILPTGASGLRYYQFGAKENTNPLVRPQCIVVE